VPAHAHAANAHESLVRLDRRDRHVLPDERSTELFEDESSHGAFSVPARFRWLSIPARPGRPHDEGKKLRGEEAGMPRTLQRITPFLWFDDQAEEAVNSYVSVFENSRVAGVTRYDDASSRAAGRPAGSVMTIEFELEGQAFTALNGGPHFTFTEAISFVVNCQTQDEVDHFWERLSAGGQEVQCGWLKDRFGVSWQIVPIVLPRMLQDKDPERARRVMAAMLEMKKISIDGLQRAYEGR
jgi:predicted 3-demethylubiquinone-9 3-methyltransferase (glyoxalase superfamily)